MNKIIKYPILLVVFCLAALFTACSDWTDTDSIDIIESDIEKDNPELYQKYLANLREYRNREHKYTYAWFNNTKEMPYSRGQRINAIPDSVDVVNLINPDELSSWVIEDMKSAQKDKGMQFVLSISYPDLEKEYELYLDQKSAKETEGEVEEEAIDEFLAYAAGFVDKRLALIDKYGYDGISVLFYGMKTNYLTESEKEAYLDREAAFMSKISGWVNNNPDKLFIYEGYPQNLTDKSVLQQAKFIVVRTDLLKYASALDYEVLSVIEDEVPIDRFMVTVSAQSFDDDKTGYYYDADNKLVSSIPTAADWVDSYNSRFTKIGLSVLNAQNDYYYSGNSYQNIRNAISIMNPSPKI